MTSFFTGSPIRLAYSHPRALPKLPEGTEKNDLFPGLCQLSIGIDIIDNLGKYSAEIDGVGRSQIELFEGGIGKGPA